MIVKNLNKVKTDIERVLSSRKKVPIFSPKGLVRKILAKRKRILQVIKNHRSPFYLYDKEELIKSVNEFKTLFNKHIPSSEIYYAMKANPHEYILKDVVRNNLGIDVSSGHELELALQTRTNKVLFTGPAKTMDELRLVLKHSQKITLNIDSFTELKKIEALLKISKKKLRVGVRIATRNHGKWNKFGIPLKDLYSLWTLLKKNSYLQPEGIQTHMSWNEDADSYKNMIIEIGNYLKSYPALKKEIQFIDLGGGFLPYKIEGLHSWSLPQGRIANILLEELGKEVIFSKKHFLSLAIPLREYAKEIGTAIKKNLSDMNCKFYFEPGRIICNNSMHIVLRVEDVKNSQLAITDGGTNMVGWERFEEEYFPIVNLTHPSLKEKVATVFGSLCTPHDIWGYFYHGTAIKEGDILVIPYQGAYTYSYAQNFIKPFPKVYAL